MSRTPPGAHAPTIENGADPAENGPVEMAHRHRLRTRGLVAMGVPIVALAVIGFALVLLLVEQRRTSEDLRRLGQVEIGLEQVLSLSLDEAVATRTYLSTMEPGLLEPVVRGRQRLPEHTGDLVHQTRNDPVSEGFEELRALVAARLEASSSVIEAVPAATDRQVEVFLSTTGPETTEAVRAHVGELRSELSELISQRELRAAALEDQLLVLVVVALVVGIAGGLVGSIAFTRRITSRVEHLAENAGRLQRGEPLEIDDAGEDEIGELADRLSTAADLLGARERDLVEARQFYERLISGSPMFIFAGSITRPDVEGGRGRFVIDYTSSTAERVLGVELEVGRLPGEERIHPDDLEQLRAGRAKVLCGEATHLEELFRFRRDDGSVRWISTVIDVDLEVSPPRVVGYATDVTERRQAEMDVRRAEAKLQGILANTPSAVFVKDLAGRYMMANPVALTVLGRSEHELVGQTDREVLPLAGAEQLAANDRRVLETQRSALFTEVLELDDGPHEFATARFPLLDEDGEPYALAGIATDVTYLSRAADRVAERERLLEVIVGNSPDLITTLDLDRRILTASPAAEPMLGADPAALAGRPLDDLIHPDDREAVAERWGRLLAGAAEPLAIRCRLQAADGEWLTTDSSLRRIVDDEGNVTSVAASVRDATGQLVLESELLAARDLAESASSAKSDFLSRMSHELRTPLNSVLGFSQLLEMSELDDDQRENVEYILRAGRHLIDLINEVLDMARIEAGGMRLSVEPVRVGDPVGMAVELMQPVAAQRECALHIAGDADVDAWVRADHQRLLEVLLNLLSNGIKYNRPGGSVVVNWRQGSEGRVRLSVTDTGLGIPPEALDAVFVPFERLGADRTDVQGTGVGLPLAKGLCELMGGQLEVLSTVGVGSTFSVVLDAASSPVPEPDEVPHEEQYDSVDPGVAHLHSSTVLYIEDNPANTDLVQRALGHRPAINLIPASHARLGLALAAVHRPALILLDLNLPDLNGAEVLHQLRADPATESIPVVVVSADATASQIRRLIDLGAADYLTKPIVVGELLAAVDRFVGNPGAAGQGSRSGPADAQPDEATSTTVGWAKVIRAQVGEPSGSVPSEQSAESADDGSATEARGEFSSRLDRSQSSSHSQHSSTSTAPSGASEQ
ncbi:MAG: PAS domain S-box protein [Acidimicrobiia bacterium]|nr:PAS domain S-box protein [Acidimicrobiia bacterium]